MYKPYANYLEIVTPALFDSHVKIKGKEFYFDPSFNPFEHARKYGVVTGLPKVLSRVPMPIQVSDGGIPAHYDHIPTRFKYLRDIEPELKLGDKVYFHHHCLKLDFLTRTEGEDDDKLWYFRVRYDQIICAVREVAKEEVHESMWDKENPDTKYKVIIPIGSYCLVEPDYETWEDILIPTYSDIKDQWGKPILKDKSLWIQKKKEPGMKSELTGTVVHIGSPLKGDQIPAQEGDKIIFHRHADWLNIIEGHQYYCLRQHLILSVMEPETPVNEKV